MSALPLEMPRHPALGVAEVPGKGRGLIAGVTLTRGDLLEVAPVIPLAVPDGRRWHPVLCDYPFAWDEPPFTEAIALGAISMANHDRNANAWFDPDLPNRVIRLFAARRIGAGEEITIDYGIDDEPWAGSHTTEETPADADPEH